MSRLNFNNPVTYLSRRVHHIICESGSNTEKSSKSFYNGISLSWPRVQEHVEAVSTDTGTDTFEYFENLSSELSECFYETEKIMHDMNPEEFVQSYKNLLRWTSFENAFSNCFQSIKNDLDGTGVIHSLLWSTAILERSLGDIYLLRGHQCPSLLKDLLLTAELRDLFGSTAIELLRLFMGPPVSLNIRNVVWHGFPIPGEIPKRFAYMILTITAALGSILDEKGITPDSIPHRPFTTFPQVTDMTRVLPDSGWQSLINLTSESGCVPPAMIPVWETAIDAYVQERYGLAVSLLLPQMEHMIRRVFAAVNECSHRVLTAENTVLFTTFDEMLEFTLPDGKENQLKDVLGENIMDLIFDVLAYPNGPRVRDRVSHGETNLEDFPQEVVDQILFACAAICMKLTSPESQIHKGNLARTIQVSLESYESVFFPINMAKRQIRQLISSLDQWVTIPRPPQTDQVDPSLTNDTARDSELRWSDPHPKALEERPSYKIVSLILNKHLPGEPQLASCITPFIGIQECLEPILCRRIPTLYRWKDTYNLPDNFTRSSKAPISVSESELVGYINRIATHAQDVSTQVRHVMECRYGQWHRKELRSRQRNTYNRMIDSVPVLSTGLRFVVIIITSLLMSIDDDLMNIHTERIKVIKQLRMILQYCENLKTYTSPAKNKWDEAVQSTEDIINRLGLQL